jgi:lipoprotein-releasing system permease protein
VIFDFLKAYLFSRRAQSHTKKMAWISFTAIVLGSFSLVVVLSIMSGLNLATENRLLKSEPHLVLIDQKKDLSVEDKLKAMGVQKSYFFETQDILFKTEDGVFGGAEAFGVKAELLTQKKSFLDDEGFPIDYDNEAFEQGDSVFMGYSLALNTGLVVGDIVEIYRPEEILKPDADLSRFTVKKVRLAGILNTMSGDKEGRYIFYNRGRLFPQGAKSFSTGYELYLKDPESASAFKNKLDSLSLKSETWRERNSSLFAALKLEKFAMTFLLGLALVITSFSIMTLLILLIVQKQKDIGILLSQGLSQRQIRFLFGGLGFTLSSLGVFVGVLFGSIVSLILDFYPLKILPPIYQDPYLPAHMDWVTVIWVMFFCLIASILSSLIPIYYLSDLSPVKALKGGLSV